VPQHRAFNKEKKRLDYVIRDKKVANGSLVPVIECQEEKIITRWVPSSESREQIRRTKAYFRRTLRALRAHRMNLESFDRSAKNNPRQSRRPDDINLLSGRSPCGVALQPAQSVEILAPDHQDRPNA
jgi:hypothetical protein